MTSDGFKFNWEEAVLWLRRQPGSEALVKACFFDDPLADAAVRYQESSEWQSVRALIGRASGAALDIGSGRGIAAFALARDGWSVTALEPDSSDVVGAGAIRQLASATNTQIRVIETWGEELPFDSSCFDLVHVRQALHHARDLTQLCKEIGRVLKPGGTMIATREHVITRRTDLAQFLKSHPLHHLYGGENAFLLDDYIQAISSAGIRLIRVLNPLESNINTYPETLASKQDYYAKKLRLPSARFIPKWLLAWMGARLNEAGRLYTFVGVKPHAPATR